jgi:hypothetical protein
MGKNIVSANFAPDELAFISQNFIHLAIMISSGRAQRA